VRCPGITGDTRGFSKPSANRLRSHPPRTVRAITTTCSGPNRVARTPAPGISRRGPVSLAWGRHRRREGSWTRTTSSGSFVLPEIGARSRSDAQRFCSPIQGSQVDLRPLVLTRTVPARGR
jgi:hypothetical protein